ncbi:hypothetical protein Bbelb_391620 [Branchiostoma belcheri]|nr:hypothetical protein Bbelb_391620 [Branchiostoma belcheri]
MKTEAVDVVAISSNRDPEETGWGAPEPTLDVRASPTGALGRRTVVCARSIWGTAYGEDMSRERATTRPNRRHKADVCVNQIKCNICEETGHAGRACQLNFANRLSMGTSWGKPVTASTTPGHTKSSGRAETSPTETFCTAKSGDAAQPAQADSAGDTAQQAAPKPGTKPPREQVVKSNSPAKTKVSKAAPTTTDLPKGAQTLPKLLKGTPESTPLPEEGANKWMSDTEDTEIAQSADGLDLKLDESGDHISEYSSEDESATKRPPSSSPSESEDSTTSRRPEKSYGKKIKKEAGNTAKGTGKVSPLSGKSEVSYKTKSAPSPRKRGRKGNLLDLIATSHPAKCYQTGTLAPLGDSDHLITATALTIQASQHSGKRLVWLYDKADIEALHQDIATAPLDKNLIFDSMDDIWDSWYSMFIAICERHIPHKVISTTRTAKPWIYSNKQIRAAIRRKHRLHSRAKRLNTEDAWATYRRQRHLVTNLTIRAETVYIEDLVNDVETGNTRRSDPTPTIQPTTVPESVLDSLQLSEEEVRQQLRTLQVGKSGGHDKITPRLLRLVADPISVPLTRGTVAQVVTSHKHIGVTLTNTLSWSQHIEFRRKFHTAVTMYKLLTVAVLHTCKVCYLERERPPENPAPPNSGNYKSSRIELPGSSYRCSKDPVSRTCTPDSTGNT